MTQALYAHMNNKRKRKKNRKRKREAGVRKIKVQG
jgi:hypothetical protein